MNWMTKLASKATLVHIVKCIKQSDSILAFACVCKSRMDVNLEQSSFLHLPLTKSSKSFKILLYVYK
jgi:hypothetical protein